MSSVSLNIWKDGLVVGPDGRVVGSTWKLVLPVIDFFWIISESAGGLNTWTPTKERNSLDALFNLEM